MSKFKDDLTLAAEKRQQELEDYWREEDAYEAYIEAKHLQEDIRNEQEGE